MKKTLLLATTIFCLLNLINAQSDRLDSSFGTNGIVKTYLGKTFNYGAPPAGKILPLPDGSIYIIHWDAGTYQNYFSKRRSDGSIDSSFGLNGQSADAGLVITEAAIQQDGKIVVTGSSDNFDFAVSRYNTNGSLDSSFSDDGKQTTDLGENYNESTWSVVIQKDKKILVAGVSYGAVYNYVSLARYNTNGSLDSTFNNNGLLKTDLLTYNTIPKVAL
jgi:uncharacterized delta-60 repeat protein